MMYFVIKLHFKISDTYCGSAVIVLPDEDAALETHTSANRFYIKRTYVGEKASKVSKRLTKRFLDNLFCISSDNIDNWILNDNKSIAPVFSRRDTIENVIEHLKKRFKEGNYDTFIGYAYTVR